MFKADCVLSTRRTGSPLSNGNNPQQIFKVQVFCDYHGFLTWRDLAIFPDVPLIFDDLRALQERLEVCPPRLPWRIVECLPHEQHPRS
jgi:hypothetical protein